MNKKVLIVEDNALNLKLFTDLLEAYNIDTAQTSDGNSVLDVARAEKPDLILMDIQLPEVSGLDVTKWLKADDELKHIPVIAVTAFAMKGDEKNIRDGGCEDYISKPINVMGFIEKVQAHLNKTPADSAASNNESDTDDVFNDDIDHDESGAEPVSESDKIQETINQ